MPEHPQPRAVARDAVEHHEVRPAAAHGQIIRPALATQERAHDSPRSPLQYATISADSVSAVWSPVG